MSIYEVLNAPQLPPKTLRCENIHITGDMADDDDVITRQFFYNNLPSGGVGNLSFVGPSQIGAHMRATTNAGLLVQESSLVENNTTFDFQNKELKTTNNVIANSFSIGGTNQQVLLADGSTAPYFSSSQSNYFLYRSRDTFLVPPGTGNIRFDNGVQQFATQIYVSHKTDDNIDIDFYLAQIQIGDILYLQDKSNSLNYIKYLVTNIAFVPNLYYTFSVTYDFGEGTGLTTFGTNHPIFLTTFLNQNLINSRLAALETKTRYQDSLITNQTSVNYTLLADTINATAINKAGQSVLTATDLIPYLTSSDAALTYQTLADMKNYTNNTLLALTYLQIGTAQTTYLSKIDAASIYQPQSGMGAYLTTANAASTYTTQTLYNSTNLSSVGAGESLVGPTSLLPNLRVRGLVAGPGITFAGSTSTDVQIGATVPEGPTGPAGPPGPSLFGALYPFPTSVRTGTSSLSTSTYFVTYTMLTNVTLALASQYFGSLGADNYRVGVYRGDLTSAVLVGQSIAGAPTTTYNNKTLTAVSGQNLSFTAGSQIVIAFTKSGGTSAPATASGASNIALASVSSTSYAAAGFPASIASVSPVLATTVRICMDLS